MPLLNDADGLAVGTALASAAYVGGTQVWSSFSPLDLSPALWLDASDTSTITASSGSVSQWNDKSGNGRNFTQATGASQPTTGTRTLNGLNVLDFDGTADFLAGGDILDVGTGGVTMIGVAKLDTATGVRGMWGKSAATSAAGRYSLVYSATEGHFNSVWHDAAARSATNDPGSMARTDTYVWGTRVARASTNTLWRNGSIVSTNSALSGTTSYNTAFLWYIGVYQTSAGTAPLANSYMDGIIGELVVFMRSLSDTEMGLVHNYLNSKWAVY